MRGGLRWNRSRSWICEPLRIGRPRDPRCDLGFDARPLFRQVEAVEAIGEVAPEPDELPEMGEATTANADPVFWITIREQLVHYVDRAEAADILLTRPTIDAARLQQDGRERETVASRLTSSDFPANVHCQRVVPKPRNMLEGFGTTTRPPMSERIALSAPPNIAPASLEINEDAVCAFGARETATGTL